MAYAAVLSRIPGQYVLKTSMAARPSFLLLKKKKQLDLHCLPPLVGADPSGSRDLAQREREGGHGWIHDLAAVLAQQFWLGVPFSS